MEIEEPKRYTGRDAYFHLYDLHLPKEIASLAKINFDASGCVNETMPPTISAALKSGFVWFSTPQGTKYWNRITRGRFPDPSKLIKKLLKEQLNRELKHIIKNTDIFNELKNEKCEIKIKWTKK